MNPKEMAAQLRRAAHELRKEAQVTEQKKMIKSAQALTAARGLAQFARILKGEAR